MQVLAGFMVSKTKIKMLKTVSIMVREIQASSRWVHGLKNKNKCAGK
jgi:hypothetical protein